MNPNRRVLRFFRQPCRCGSGHPIYYPYFRFFETLDEYFDYAPSPTPPQGRWRIYGIGLPDPILKKVYHNNAARLGMAEI